MTPVLAVAEKSSKSAVVKKNNMKNIKNNTIEIKLAKIICILRRKRGKPFQSSR